MIGKRKRIRQQLKHGAKATPHELASCYGKIRYEKHEKERALEGRPSFIKFYKCKHCPYFHIGRRKEK
jgi:hypothetical protein